MPLVVTPTVVIDDALLWERFVRGSGPGGQNVNKVATAVELRFDLGRSGLSEPVKTRLRVLAGSRFIDDDVVVVEAREHRTQLKNREAARARLAALIAQALVVPKRRTKTRPSAGAREQRLESKVRRARVKAGRGRVKDE